MAVNDSRLNGDSQDMSDMNPTQTILIAEDETSLLEALVRFLELKGYRTLKAANGTDALKLYMERQKDICLCLIDLNMPQLDGENCIRRLRELSPNLPVFLLTGETEEEDVSSELMQMVDCCLRKPFDWSKLVKRITERLED